MQKRDSILLVVVHVLLALLYWQGLRLDIMDVDASQYASIAMEMVQTDTWLQVQHRGMDYLDKPPLLFWLSALSYKVFGLGNIAYKLPSFLVAMLGVWGLYRFALLYYPRKIARHAALIFLSSQALLLICHDVRTDTLLLGFGTCAVWQLAHFLEKNRWKNLLFASLFVGLAMLAKGPIGLIVPIFAVGTHLALRREWKQFFRWEWLLGLVLVALVLAPMSWGLYQQFDIHPEKSINGKTGVSGLYFYFWEQSFGRITGENVWKNDSGPFYFFHTYLWAFLPWSLLIIGALWHRLKDLFQGNFSLQNTQKEGYAIGGLILTFIALSLSKYKLPHYIFITLPWASVMVAAYLDYIFSENKKAKRFWVGVQYLTFAAIIGLSAFLVFYVFPSENGIWKGVFAVLIAVLGFYFYTSKSDKTAKTLIFQGVFIAIFANLFLNFFFYPRLMDYQGTAKLMQAVHSKDLPKSDVFLFEKHAHTVDVYGQKIFSSLTENALIEKSKNAASPFYISTNKHGRSIINLKEIPYKEVGVYPQFQIARLNQKFLNPATRAATLDSMFLLKIGYEK